MRLAPLAAAAAAALALSATAHAADMPTAPNTLTAEESAAGWQLLFDGKSSRTGAPATSPVPSA